MGAEQSAPSGDGHRTRRGTRHTPSANRAAYNGVSLWEGVPGEVLWLVQAQVKLLLTKYIKTLLHRPEQYLTDHSELAGQALAPREAQLAESALNDPALASRLQLVRDRLVPIHLSEEQFWDNFLSHVDVIKLNLVTDFLQSQDRVVKEDAERREQWVAAYDALEPELQLDLKRAAEKIAIEQKVPDPGLVDTHLGIDPPPPLAYAPHGDSWTEYVEGGPYEIFKVLQKTLRERNPPEPAEEAPAPLLARLSADSPAAVPDEQSGRSSRDETARDLERLRAVSAEAEEEVAAAAATGAHPLATAAQPVVQAFEADEPAVQRLASLGFEAERCREALRANGGDEARAEEWLLRN